MTPFAEAAFPAAVADLFMQTSLMQRKGPLWHLWHMSVKAEHTAHKKSVYSQYNTSFITVLIFICKLQNFQLGKSLIVKQNTGCVISLKWYNTSLKSKFRKQQTASYFLFCFVYQPDLHWRGRRVGENGRKGAEETLPLALETAALSRRQPGGRAAGSRD